MSSAKARQFALLGTSGLMVTVLDRNWVSRWHSKMKGKKFIAGMKIPFRKNISSSIGMDCSNSQSAE